MVRLCPACAKVRRNFLRLPGPAKLARGIGEPANDAQPGIEEGGGGAVSARGGAGGLGSSSSLSWSRVEFLFDRSF
jgi:hypothetical protein